MDKKNASNDQLHDDKAALLKKLLQRNSRSDQKCSQRSKPVGTFPLSIGQQGHWLLHEL